MKVSGCLINPFTLYASVPFLGTFSICLTSLREVVLSQFIKQHTNQHRQAGKARKAEREAHREEGGFECSWSNKITV